VGPAILIHKSSIRYFNQEIGFFVHFKAEERKKCTKNILNRALSVGLSLTFENFIYLFIFDKSFLTGQQGSTVVLVLLKCWQDERAGGTGMSWVWDPLCLCFKLHKSQTSLSWFCRIGFGFSVFVLFLTLVFSLSFHSVSNDIHLKSILEIHAHYPLPDPKYIY
jgi:hypothetical protein